jgi:hypothetical protein
VGVDNIVQIYMDNNANMFDVPRFQANPSVKSICTLGNFSHKKFPTLILLALNDISS